MMEGQPSFHAVNPLFGRHPVFAPSSNDASLTQRLLPESPDPVPKPNHVLWTSPLDASARGHARLDQQRAVDTLIRDCGTATDTVRSYIAQRPAAAPSRLEALVPFVGSRRRRNEQKTLERLRKIDDDLRWLDKLHKEWTDLDHMSEKSRDYRFLAFALRMIASSINGQIDRL